MLAHKIGAVGALAAAMVALCPSVTAFAEGGRSGGGGSSCSYGGDENTCSPGNRQECYEECAYWHGREIEACNRKKDKKKRPACYDKANQKHATCRRECEKKFPKE